MKIKIKNAEMILKNEKTKREKERKEREIKKDYSEIIKKRNKREKKKKKFNQSIKKYIHFFSPPSFILSLSLYPHPLHPTFPLLFSFTLVMRSFLFIYLFKEELALIFSLPL